MAITNSNQSDHSCDIIITKDNVEALINDWILYEDKVTKSFTNHPDTIKMNKVILGSSLTNDLTMKVFEWIAKKPGLRINKLLNEYPYKEEERNLEALEPSILAKAIVKVKTWEFPYNFQMTTEQISEILSEVGKSEPSQVELLDLVDINLHGIAEKVIAEAVVKVKTVRFSYISKSQLEAVYKLVLETKDLSTETIRFIHYNIIPKRLDKDLVMSVINKINVEIADHLQSFKIKLMCQVMQNKALYRALNVAKEDLDKEI